ANPIREFAAQGTVLGLSGSLPAVLAKDFFARSGIQVETVIRSLGRHNLQQFVIDLENEGEQSLLLVALLRDVKAPNNAIVYCP
ncbi:hypothetical protein, partial [Pseudomonas sp. FW305-131]|uniref:hypothetical protein n=1 Tax=Pseudomonas sp. FW305-131 TaxID=2070670 RepID=UPI001C43A4DA